MRGCETLLRVLLGTQDKVLTGGPMKNVAGIRLRMARSTSCGRFVAPITMTQQLLSVVRPSHMDMKSALTMAVASWSCVSRVRRSESISSMKMMHGWIFTASVNTAAASFWLSPYLCVPVKHRVIHCYSQMEKIFDT